MSTRGAIGFKLNGQSKIAYNHFDSYPDGLGYDVVNFVLRVNAENGWAALKAKVNSLTAATSSDDEMDDLEGAPMLHAVYDGVLTKFPDDADFMKDGLFNEYSYIVNLDNMVLECFDSGKLLQSIDLSAVSSERLDEVYGEG